MKNEIAFELMHAFYQLHRQKMNSAPVQGMAPRELRILRSIQQLDSGPGITVSELSNLWKVSAASISQAVNGLEERGLVARTTDSVDRRVVRLCLTALGQKTIHQVNQEFTIIFSGLVNYLGSQKSEELVDLLHQVYQYFESLEGDGDV